MGEPSRKLPEYDPDSRSANLCRRRLIRRGVEDPTPLQIEVEWETWRDEEIAREAKKQADHEAECRAYQAKKKAEARKERTGHAVNWYTSIDVEDGNPAGWGMIGLDMIALIRERVRGNSSAAYVMFAMLSRRQSRADKPDPGLVKIKPKDIARELGMKLTHVCRALAVLEKTRLIMRRGQHILILGPE